MLNFRPYYNKKGIVLYIVLCVVFVVLTLAGVVLSITSNQSRLARHRIGRVQAYYAAMAGATYAFERLRAGTWTSASCPAATPCVVNDANFPPSVAGKNFTVITAASGGACAAPPGGTCANVTVSYAYP